MTWEYFIKLCTIFHDFLFKEKFLHSSINPPNRKRRKKKQKEALQKYCDFVSAFLILFFANCLFLSFQLRMKNLKKKDLEWNLIGFVSFFLTSLNVCQINIDAISLLFVLILTNFLMGGKNESSLMVFFVWMGKWKLAISKIFDFWEDLMSFGLILDRFCEYCLSKFASCWDY